MKVAVKWLKSPRHIYGIPRGPGSFSSLEVGFAKKVREDDPDMFESPELDKLEKEKPVKVKDTQAKKAKTRPVEKES